MLQIIATYQLLSGISRMSIHHLNTFICRIQQQARLSGLFLSNGLRRNIHLPTLCWQSIPEITYTYSTPSIHVRYRCDSRRRRGRKIVLVTNVCCAPLYFKWPFEGGEAGFPHPIPSFVLTQVTIYYWQESMDHLLM